MACFLHTLTDMVFFWYSGGLPSFQRNEAGSNRPSGNLDCVSDGSLEGMKSSPFESLAERDRALTSEGISKLSKANSLVGRGIAGRNSGGMGGVRNSMSMSSLSSTKMPSLHPTSSTYEQYLSNVDETAEEEEGGIFF